MAKQNKTLEYRRARFVDDGQNLEKLLRQAWGKFKTQDERTIKFKDDRSSCGLRAQDFEENGFAVHCARYTDGQGVGTIPTAPASAVDVGERAPAPGENFLNSDFMALIKDNHVICMNCGRNAGALRIYIQLLSQKASLPDAPNQFELIRIGNPNKLALIKAEGVKKIDLEVGIAETTAHDVLESDDDSGIYPFFKQKLGETLTALTKCDETVEQLQRAERGTMMMSINVPRGDIEAAKHGLDDLAEEVIEDDEAEAFVIHLRNGDIIKPDAVSVRKQIKLEAAANSVSVSETWDAMKTYMSELKDNGQLEA